MDKENGEETGINPRPMNTGIPEQKSSRRPWVKPAFEREPLKKALSGTPFTGHSDGVGSCQS
jgi:hypothetical protein